MAPESLEEVERVDELIGEMPGFAPGRHELKENLDLAAEIRSAVKFVQHLSERDEIELRVNLSEQGGWVRFDRSRFRQLLGISIRTLQRKLKAWGLTARDEAPAEQPDGD